MLRKASTEASKACFLGPIIQLWYFTLFVARLDRPCSISIAANRQLGIAVFGGEGVLADCCFPLGGAPRGRGMNPNMLPAFFSSSWVTFVLGRAEWSFYQPVTWHCQTSSQLLQRMTTLAYFSAAAERGSVPLVVSKVLVRGGKYEGALR